MSIGLEIKKLMSFFNRRKWIILIFMIVFAGAFSANALTKKPVVQVAGDSNVTLNKEKYKGTYYSEFRFYIENKQDGRPVSYVQTIKNNVLSNEQVAKMKASGMEISYNELRDAVEIYNTNKSGEQLYLLVHTKDKAKTEAIVSSLYEVFKNQENVYFENKTVSTLSTPTVATDKWEPDGVVSATTNAGLTNIVQEEKGLTADDSDSQKTTEPTGTVKKASVPQYAIIGVFLGLVVGIFVGIFMDMKSKKIQSMAYLNPLVKEDEVIFDGTAFEMEDTANYLAIDAASKKCTSVLVLSEQNEFVPAEIKNKFSQVATHLTVDELSDNQMIFIVVKSGSTSTKWLKTEYGIISGTALNYQIILL